MTPVRLEPVASRSQVKHSTTGRTDAQQSLFHKEGCYLCQWKVDNVDMHIYAKFDQNIPMWFKSYEHFH